jgi:hypothetical protein
MSDIALDPTVKVTVAYDLADFRNFHAWMLWRSLRWHVLALAACSPVACIASFFFFGTTAALGFLIFIAIVIPTAHLIGVLRLSSRTYKAHLRLGEFSYTFTGDGFEYYTKLASAKTSWEAVSNTAETSRSILLGFENTTFLLLPKRCFSVDDLRTFRNILRDKLPAKIRVNLS